MAAALEGRTAALMANHGAVNYGVDLDGAVERTLLLEWACGVYWRARALGEPRVLDEARARGGGRGRRRARVRHDRGRREEGG